MKSSGQKILRSTALVMGLTFLAKAAGFFRDIIVAAQFGTSMEMDAFIVAATIVSLLFVWLRNPIQVVIIPLFTRDLKTRGERLAWQNASVLMNSLIVLLFLLAGVGWFVSPYLVRIVAPGFGQEAGNLSAEMVGPLMLTLIFLGWAQILSGFFRSYQRFGWQGTIRTVDNLVVIPLIIFLTPVLGIRGLVISTILGAIAQALVLTPILWKHRSYYKPAIDPKNPTLRRMAKMSLPLLIGTGGAGLGKMSDRIFASLLPTGSLSALSYGHRLTYANFDLFIVSLTTVLFPFFSETAGSEKYEDLERKLFKSLRTLFWVFLPLSIGILLLHEPLVRLVYHRGAFDEMSVGMTSQAVLFYAIGLSAYSLSSVLSSACYSLQDTKTPVMAGLVRLGVKIVLSFILVKPMAHAGLALAESLSFVVKAVLLLLYLPKQIRQTEYRKVFKSFGETAVVAGPMAIVVFLMLPVIEKFFGAGTSFVGTSVGLGATAVLGAGTYLAGSLILQRTELRDFYRFVRSGLGGH